MLYDGNCLALRLHLKCVSTAVQCHELHYYIKSRETVGVTRVILRHCSRPLLHIVRLPMM